MPAEINYKNKYLELRAKYMGDLDMAFRLGFEQGKQQQQQNQVAEQQAQAMQLQEAALQGQAGPGGEGGGGDFGGGGGEKPGNESAPGGEATPGGQPTSPQNAAPEAGGSEIDKHIATLEGLIGTGGAPSNPGDIKKSIEALKSLRKAQVQAAELKKSQMAIDGIAKALHKPKFKMTAQASHNLNSNAKTAVSMQHKIVKDLMEKMEQEEARATNSISKVLDVEGLTKG